MKPPKFVKEIWIMTKTGIPLLHSAHIRDINGDLFAGFVSAITSFATDIFIEKCQNITMASFKLSLLHNSNPDLIFICRSSVSTSELKINYYLNNLREHFLAIHAEDLKEFTGKMKCFNNSKILAEFSAEG
ncbi:hypothetical protein NEF87_004783 [Candidatus Lokiarchaeum ossiferum]|uniref:Uncharacterized protein n=1 Tax=Candidatus Lokiarchaeum ossiferum TaxID=2951803 RepID=A0ABY6HYN0_9ARCH|nr:hypothetical protein NEF87_004783 [Candidatus Lokiarchaeum sp. B-35]